MPKLVILLGSGATRAQAAANTALKNQPPLDKGFFSQIRAPFPDDSRLFEVRKYIWQQYRYDIAKPNLDSFEAVASILYTDASTRRTQDQAYPVLLTLLQFLSERIAETTNPIYPSSHRVLQRILRKKIDELKPENISIVTFNYDLEIELALRHVSITSNYRRNRILVFPGCYRLPTHPIHGIESLERFASSAELDDNHIGIPILKLHGSLNWYTSYNQMQPSQDRFLSSGDRLFRIANSDELPSWPLLTKSASKRRHFGYPVLVPPVPHKAALFHEEIKNLWSIAAMALGAADELLVFGYSCPSQDQEAANLIRSMAGRNNGLRQVTIIDPNSAIAERFVELLDARSCMWFRSAREYLRWMDGK